MKIPETAPQTRLSPEFVADLPAMTDRLGDVFRNAQDDYLYWDRFKHLSMPEGVVPADAWALVKMARKLSRRLTPIPDGAGGHFTYSVTANVMRALHNIDKWAGGWDASTSSHLPHDAQRERYVLSSLVEESIASSQIEGASTTRRRAREMLLNQEKPRNTGEQMILNNYRTMQRIRELTDEPITPQLLLELQRSMTVETLPHSEDAGVFRTSGDIVVADEVNRILYTPPQAAEIPSMVDALCRYANRTDNAFEHPAIKAIALHFWLALIHPFADGNGRTARALFYLFMLKNNYWLFEYLSISRIILRRRAQYERAYLYTETDDADFTYFLHFNLRAVETAIEETRRYVEKKVDEDARVQEQVQHDAELNYRQRAALARAARKPDAVFTFQSHATSHGVVLATARGDLLELAERGYLVRHKAGRQVVFSPAPDLRGRLAHR
jgi:Fic family protein